MNSFPVKFLLVLAGVIPSLPAFGFGPGMSPAVPSPAAKPSFEAELRKLLESATRKRRGVLIWMDMENGTRLVVGDGRLSAEKFVPGSLLKLLTAEAALKTRADFTWNCPGHKTVEGRRMHCWTHKGHGPQHLAGALGVSCNLYFASLALANGWDAWAAALAASPFSEGKGLAKKKLSQWDLAHAAIGDYLDFKVTPGEVADYWRALLPRLKEPAYAPMQQGLLRAVDYGTARGIEQGPLQILAKTGTGDATASTHATNGWLVGAYPGVAPRWAWVVFLQEAHGFREATRLTDRIVRLAVEHGLFGNDSK